MDSADAAYAGFWIRVGAYLLDQLVFLAIVVVLAFTTAFVTYMLVDLLGRTLDVDKYANVLTGVLVYPGLWLYWTVFESRFQGTPGKLVFGLRVTDEHGARISFGRANGRLFSKLLSGLLFGAGFLMVAFNPRKQGLHDRIARTLVIRRASPS